MENGMEFLMFIFGKEFFYLKKTWIWINLSWYLYIWVILYFVYLIKIIVQMVSLMNEFIPTVHRQWMKMQLL